MTVENGKRPILVVDDEPDMLDSLRSLLRHDFEVYSAGSGAEGAAILEKQEIHVVMTDQRMPQMTGVDFLKKVKNDHPEAIRVIFTGYADIGAVIDAINQGNVFRYVSKPWDPEQLIATLQEGGRQYDLILERRQLLEDVKRNEEDWLTFDSHMQVARTDALSPVEMEQREKLYREAREFLCPARVFHWIVRPALTDPQDMPVRSPGKGGRVSRFELERLIEQLLGARKDVARRVVHVFLRAQEQLSQTGTSGSRHVGSRANVPVWDI